MKHRRCGVSVTEMGECDSLAEHDLAEEHVFQCSDGLGAVDGVITLKGLEEVGVGRLPVLLLSCVDDSCMGKATEDSHTP